jgi:outer membrane murein-binding lipoprotein Lpp
MSKIIPTLAMVAYAALAGIVLGLGGGYWLTSGWYAPRLENAELRVGELAGALKKQNDAVETLGKKQKQMAEDLKTAQDAAKKRTAERQTKVQSILATPLPPGADQCAAASDLIRQELAK